MGRIYQRSVKVRMIHDHTGFPRSILWILPENTLNRLYEKLYAYQFMCMKQPFIEENDK